MKNIINIVLMLITLSSFSQTIHLTDSQIMVLANRYNQYQNNLSNYRVNSINLIDSVTDRDAEIRSIKKDIERINQKFYNDSINLIFVRDTLLKIGNINEYLNTCKKLKELSAKKLLSLNESEAFHARWGSWALYSEEIFYYRILINYSTTETSGFLQIIKYYPKFNEFEMEQN
jgi:hypothetical protein